MRTAPNYTPEIGLRVRRLLGDRAGQVLTISRVIAQDPDGITSIQGVYDDGYEANFNAERFELESAAPAPILAPPALMPFFVGQMAIISARVLDDNRDSNRDCEVAAKYVGQIVEIIDLDANGRLRFQWNNGANAWQLLPEYLDALDVKSAAVADFMHLWRLSLSGSCTELGSVMNLLWEPLGKPVETLSRQRGDWNVMIVTRAVLRLRRQVPNSYEERLTKGHFSNQTRLWSNIWTASNR